MKTWTRGFTHQHAPKRAYSAGLSRFQQLSKRLKEQRGSKRLKKTQKGSKRLKKAQKVSVDNKKCSYNGHENQNCWDNRETQHFKQVDLHSAEVCGTIGHNFKCWVTDLSGAFCTFLLELYREESKMGQKINSAETQEHLTLSILNKFDFDLVGSFVVSSPSCGELWWAGEPWWAVVSCGEPWWAVVSLGDVFIHTRFRVNILWFS